MTSVPPEAEEAARSLARTEYDVTESEVDVLASDPRFALGAYVRREVGRATDTVSPVRGPTPLDHEDEGGRDPEDVSETEAEALRAMYGAYGALMDATDALAEVALDREVRTLTTEEMFSRAIASAAGGEGP